MYAKVQLSAGALVNKRSPDHATTPHPSTMGVSAPSSHSHETKVVNVPTEPHTAPVERQSYLNTPKPDSVKGVSRHGDSAVIFSGTVNDDSIAGLRAILITLYEEDFDRQIRTLQLADPKLHSGEYAGNATGSHTNGLPSEAEKRGVHRQLVDALTQAIEETGITQSVGEAVNLKNLITTPLEEIASEADKSGVEAPAPPHDLSEVPIELFLSSRGGHLAPTFGLVDDMIRWQNTPRELPKEMRPDLHGLDRFMWPRQIRTHPVGYALSAAFLIMLGGNLRQMSDHSVIMMHEIGYMSMGKQSDHRNKEANVAVSNNSIMEIVGRRSGLVQYAFYGKVGGSLACIFVEPAATQGGFTPRAFVRPVPLESGRGHASIVPLPENHEEGVVIIDLQAPVMAAHDGSLRDMPPRYARQLADSRKIWSVPTSFAPTATPAPSSTPLTQLARLNGPRFEEWKRATRELDDATKTAWRPTAALVASSDSETAQNVMARFAQNDNNTDAYNARMMGFTNSGHVPIRPTKTMDPYVALVPDSAKF